jgi:hypothetical protein
MKIKIKPQLGVTYECYMGMSDRYGDRIRRKRRFCYTGFILAEHYYLRPVSGKGVTMIIPAKKFVAHFCPVNPIEYGDE